MPAKGSKRNCGSELILSALEPAKEMISRCYKNRFKVGHSEMLFQKYLRDA